MNPFDLTGRVAIVTGTSRGLGQQFAGALAKAGADLVLTSRTIGTLAPFEAEIKKLGRRALSLALDVRDHERIEQMVAAAGEVFGRIDILVNNAGIQHVSPITEFPEAKWRQIIEIMLTAPFLLTKAVLPGMYERKWGRVINIASVHALRASAFKSAYVTAKHGLLGLTRVTALEAAEHGVTCNAICPSYVRTPLVEKQIADQARVHGIPESEVVEKIMVTEGAIHRLLEPEEVAQLVTYLCSDAASGITGSAQVIDCGWTAK